MKIGDIVRDICCTKRNDLDEDISWDDIAISPYMLNRWVSMTNPRNIKILNGFPNSGVCSSVEDSKLLYHYLSAFCSSYGRFQYFKKQKREPVEEKQETRQVMDEFEIGSREAEMYNEFLNQLNKQRESDNC